MFGMHEQSKFIDAAVTASVKRFFPTEYGLEDIPEWLLQLRPNFRTKHEVREYRTAWEKEGLSWTGVVCNSFFQFAVLQGLGQIDLQTQKVEPVDGGKTEWDATTLDTVALAIVRAIERSDQTKNQLLLIQDFKTCQKQILDALQSRVGPFDVSAVESSAWVADAKQQVKAGDHSKALRLTFSLMASKGTEVDFERRETYANELLELPKKTFEEAMQPLLKQL